MKQIIIIFVTLLSSSIALSASVGDQCKYAKHNQKIVLDGLIEQEGELLCEFNGFGAFGSDDKVLQMNCSQIDKICGGKLEVGATIWAEVTTGPNPKCKQMGGCSSVSKISRLLEPETCQKKSLDCELTACGCGEGCSSKPYPEGPFCEAYLPGPGPANCVNGPNWPGNRPKNP